MARQRSWWGWGWEDEQLGDDAARRVAAAASARLGTELTVGSVPRLEDVELRAPRVRAPATLSHLCSDDRRDRALHTYGRSYRDVVRGLRGELQQPPDLVAHPGTEQDVIDLLDWCASRRIAAVPFGGGSSVVGGVECSVGDDHTGVVSVDMTGLDRVIEVDRTSRAARIQAGALGPTLEDQLRAHGLTLRHFPQSFEFSTLGGWLATRSGGHYAMHLTHIDDLVESLRVVTPRGVGESRRLPGSGAGPSPDRLFLGSEGALGVITEAWMRLQDRPRWRASAGVHFARWEDGVAATRAISQSGLWPANCRLLDRGEAALSAGSADVGAVLVLGFESADHPVEVPSARALELCRDHGGDVPGGVRMSGPEGVGTSDGRDGEPSNPTERPDAVSTWRSSFLRAPYLRDTLARCSAIMDTFETACTWDRFPELHADVTDVVGRALRDICGTGWVTCRFTHVYPDGPAPYFTVAAPGRPGSEVAMWDDIKAAASDAVLAAGGTITHHHAVGRDHLPWYERQRPEPFAQALAAAKSALDPAGILNPGVLGLPAGA